MSSSHTKSQEIYLTIGMTISSFLSICGSILVIVLATRRLLSPKSPSNSFTINPVYLRLMIALGLSDVIMSTGSALTNIMYPEGLELSYQLSMGNTTTCTIAGYLASIFNLSGAMCNAFLAHYFLLTVKSSLRMESDFVVYSRVWLAAIILVPHAIGMTGLATKSFNPHEDLPACWLNEYKYQCGNDDDGLDILCTRGNTISMILRYSLLFLIFIFSMVAMIFTFIVWRTYRKIIQKSRRHSFVATGTTDSRRRSMSSSSLPVNRNDEYLREATTQAILYCLAYTNQTFWIVLSFATSNAGETSRLIVLLFGHSLYAITGLLNAIIYLRPPYVRIRKQAPKLSKMQALWLVVCDKPPEEDPNGVNLDTVEEQQHEEKEGAAVVRMAPSAGTWCWVIRSIYAS